MRILFIVPKPRKFYFYTGEKLPPIGLAYLSAVLRNRGDKVKIFDNYLFNKNNIEPIIDNFKPDIVGISISSMTARNGYKIAKIAKDRGIITIAGGPHATLSPKQAISNGFVDYVIVGEGEITIKKLIDNIELGNNKKIKGVYYKDGTFTPQILIKDLDTLPFPAWDLVHLEKYPRKSEFIKDTPVDSLNTSRGCPFNCIFCSVKSIWGRTYRAFSPERVFEEVLLLKKNHNSKVIYFREDNFTAIRRRVEKFCNILRKEKLNIKWMCESRVDTLNKSLLLKMKKSGCETIYFGIESGSQKILNYMKKGINLNQVKKVIKLCNQIGIKSCTSFMVGIPEETFFTIRETIRFIIDINPNFYWINIYTPLPRSELYDKIMEKGWFEEYDEVSGLSHLKTPNFDFETIKFWLKRAWKEEQRNLKYWLFKLRRFNFNNLKYYIKKYT
ncbi:MAG: B12-binding domain-containing radical SAM protein [Candidatus Helarchaeota archaeon]